MEYIYDRLRNDIFGSINPGLCLVKSLESSVRINDNIYSIEKHCDNYNARYRLCRFDIAGRFFFTSYSGSSGINFLDFINSVLNDEIRNLIRPDRFTLQNVRKNLFGVKTVTIAKTEIDDLLIQCLKKYFHDLDGIKFINCIIKSGCNFNDMNVPLEFDNCVIENIRSFNECYSDISFERLFIHKISPTVIYSKKIDVSRSFRNDDIKNIFLKCSFPELLDIRIEPNYYANFSFEDALIYLPYSAPNLETLTLQGKVASLDFLTKFKNLISFNILSKSDDLGLFSTVVTNRCERERIVKRNQTEFQIQKILHPYEDEKCIIGNIERVRIYHLCNFLSTISYNEVEKNFYLSGKNVFDDSQISIPLNIDDYYDCYGDRLYHRSRRINALSDYLSLYGYHLVGNFLYSRYRNILVSKNFIYHCNGKPIVFCGRSKRITTTKEAEEMAIRVSPKNSSLDEDSYNAFIECLKNNSFSRITVGQMKDFMSEEAYGYRVDGKEFLSFGEYGKKIAYIFDRYDRIEQRLSSLQTKSKKYSDSMLKLIEEIYQQLSLQEKIYLYCHMTDYMIHVPIDIDIEKKRFLTIYGISCENEEEALESINQKTNSLYSKYSKMKYLIYNQCHLEGFNSYDIEINSDYIKKLEFPKK